MKCPYTKYIPKGVKVQPSGHWAFNEEVGVRETPGDDIAIVELTQEMTDVGEDDSDTQYISLSLGQAQTLRDVLNELIAKYGEV